MARLSSVGGGLIWGSRPRPRCWAPGCDNAPSSRDKRFCWPHLPEPDDYIPLSPRPLQVLIESITHELESHAGSATLGINGLARKIEMHPRQIHKILSREKPMTPDAADRWAIRFGKHPIEIWGDAWLVGDEEDDMRLRNLAHPVNPEDVITAVAQHFHLDQADVMTARWQPASLARQIVFYLVRETTGYSYPRIAAIFQMDHSTIIYGVRRVQTLLVQDEELRLLIERLTDRLETVAA